MVFVYMQGYALLSNLFSSELLFYRLKGVKLSKLHCVNKGNKSKKENKHENRILCEEFQKSENFNIFRAILPDFFWLVDLFFQKHKFMNNRF